MIRIRKANDSDAMGIAIVQAYTWMTTYNGLIPDEVLEARINGIIGQAEYIREQISLGHRYLVAECMDAIVGFAAFGSSRNEQYPCDGEIFGLYVLKGFQGKGIGRRLFKGCVEILAAEGQRGMILNCLKGNASVGFYLNMGGGIVGSRRDAIRGGHIICEDVIRFDIGGNEHENSDAGK